MLDGDFCGKEELIINLHNEHRGGRERGMEQDTRGMEIIKKERYFYTPKRSAARSIEVGLKLYICAKKLPRQSSTKQQGARYRNITQHGVRDRT